MLLGNSKRNITMKRSWEVSTVIWPAIILSNHSEKPSILKVIDDIVSKTVKNVETTAIDLKVQSLARPRRYKRLVKCIIRCDEIYESFIFKPLRETISTEGDG